MRPHTRTDPRRTLAPLLVLGVALLLSGAAAGMVAWTSQARDAARFDHAVDGATDRITARLNNYVTLLRAGAALVSASEQVTADEFERFVERFALPTRYPGIQGIGYSVRVRPEQRDSLVAAQRAGRFADFRIWPDAPPGTERHTIAYLFPLDRRNRAAVGYDMFSEPTRRRAMEAARDRGESTMSGRVTLVQEIEGPAQAGFLIYTPVYREGPAPATPELRREALDGFVYAPFRADDLFEGIFGSEARPRVAFRVYDGAAADPERLLHDSRVQGVVPSASPRFEHTDTVRVAGRLWTVAFASTAAFEAESRRGVWMLMLALGAAASAGLFLLTRRQVAARADADAARHEADAANRAKADFLAAMSHELRTPLNAIMGYADLMDLGVHGPVTDQQRHALDRIRRSQHHLLALINDILNFAKLEAGRVEVRRDTVAMGPLLADLQAMTEPQVRERGLHASYAACDGAIAACGDADKIQQILLNLLSNAIKFTPPGGHIGVSCEPAGDRVVVRVADTGQGIPADRMATVFDPFVQVDRSAGEDGRHGVGLGLAISRDLAVLMDGELTAASDVGRGSVFTLVLPRAAPPGGEPR